MIDDRAIIKTCLEARKKCREKTKLYCHMNSYCDMDDIYCQYPYYHNLCDLVIDIRLVIIENPLVNFSHVCLDLKPSELYDLAVQVLLNI